MKRHLALGILALGLQGCAFQHDVQRIGVGYNNAVSDLSNQLTLLNIVRAENRQPLHFMAFSRLSGSLVFTGTSGFNAAIHDAGKTATSTSETDVAGLTETTKNTATTETDITSPVTTTKNTIVNALTTGGHIYTPSIGAQVVTGPSFDMDLLDTQTFYQGILGQIPITTVEALQDQGFDGRLLLALFVERVDFTALPDSSDPLGYKFDKGVLLQTLINDPESDQGELFMTYMCGASLSSQPAAAKKLVPFAPIAAASGRNAITLKDLASLDGKALELEPDPSAPDDASKVYVVRPTDKRVAKFNWGTCTALNIPPPNYPHRTVVLDREVQATLGGGEADAPTILADGKRLARKYPTPEFPDDSRDAAGKELAKKLVASNQDASDQKKHGVIIDTAKIKFIRSDGTEVLVNSAVSVVMRSPEGVIRYLGAYLRASRMAALQRQPAPYQVEYPQSDAKKLPVFQVETAGKSPSLVSTELAGVRYSIPGHVGVDEDDQAIRDMQILALIEELVDLQKSGTDRPSTVPVQVVP